MMRMQIYALSKGEVGETAAVDQRNLTAKASISNIQSGE
jgi:hypothetical protein